MDVKKEAPLAGNEEKPAVPHYAIKDLRVRPYDIVSLYTPLTSNGAPDVYGRRCEFFTRTVVLCERDSDFIMIDGLSFSLILSIDSRIDLERLHKFILHSYAYTHYMPEEVSTQDANETTDQATTGVESMDSVIKQESEIGEVSSVTVNEFASPFIRYVMQNVKEKNIKDYNFYRQYLCASPGKRFILERKDPDLTKDHHPTDRDYNIEFIKSMIQLPRNNKYRDETQYKVTFRNHRLLLYFFNRFKYDVKIDRIPYRVRVLDPSTQVAFNGTPRQYLENQLLPLQRKRMNFENQESIQCGLLEPGCVEESDSLHNSVENTILNLMAHRGGGSTEKRNESFMNEFYYCAHGDEIKQEDDEEEEEEEVEAPTLSIVKQEPQEENPEKEDSSPDTVKKEAQLNQPVKQKPPEAAFCYSKVYVDLETVVGKGIKRVIYNQRRESLFDPVRADEKKETKTKKSKTPTREEKEPACLRKSKIDGFVSALEPFAALSAVEPPNEKKRKREDTKLLTPDRKNKKGKKRKKDTRVQMQLANFIVEENPKKEKRQTTGKKSNKKPSVKYKSSSIDAAVKNENSSAAMKTEPT